MFYFRVKRVSSMKSCDAFSLLSGVFLSFSALCLALQSPAPGGAAATDECLCGSAGGASTRAVCLFTAVDLGS